MNGSDSNLRAMIRYIRIARALKDEVEEVQSLELQEGSGDLLLGSVERLLRGVAAVTDDPFVASLKEGLSGLADDAQKALAIRLALSQLLAFLETETGVAGLTGKTFRGGSNVNIGSVTGMTAEEVARMAGLVRGAPPAGEQAKE